MQKNEVGPLYCILKQKQKQKPSKWTKTTKISEENRKNFMTLDLAVLVRTPKA